MLAESMEIETGTASRNRGFEDRAECVGPKKGLKVTRTKIGGQLTVSKVTLVPTAPHLVGEYGPPFSGP